MKKWHIILTSPEAILSTHRNIVKKRVFSEDLKLIAVDESHCIKKW